LSVPSFILLFVSHVFQLVSFLNRIALIEYDLKLSEAWNELITIDDNDCANHFSR